MKILYRVPKVVEVEVEAATLVDGVYTNGSVSVTRRVG